MRYMRKRFRQAPQEPATRRYDDGREICLNNPPGRAEYIRRKQLLWAEQQGQCALDSCPNGGRIGIEESRMTGGNWEPTGQLRDDQLHSGGGKKLNYLVHKACMTEWHRQNSRAKLNLVTVVTAMVVMLCCLAFTPITTAQSSNASAVSGQVVSPGGQPASGALVRVCRVTAFGSPCPTTGVSLYADSQLTVPIANPQSADQYGNYSFFTNIGLYLIQVTPQTGITYSYAWAAGGFGGGSPGVFPQSITQTAGQALVAYDATTGLFTKVPIGGGTVTNVTGTTANGFTVSVAFGSTTPQISVATSAGFYLPTTGDQTNWNAKVNRSGDTMTGPLNLSGQPTTNTQAANKLYVDNGDASVLAVASNALSTANTALTVANAAQPSNQKNQPNGYAGLDAGGHILQAQLPPDIAYTDVINNFTVGQNFGAGISVTGLATATTATIANLLTSGSISTGAITATGNVSTTASPGFTGDGSQLTALNASNISSGTLAPARFPVAAITGGTINGTVIGGTTPAAGTFTTLGGTTITASTGFVGPGSGITAINGANITTGNIAAARINNALLAPGPIGTTTPNIIASTTITATGNITAAGTVNATANFTPASITNTGVALVGNPGVGAEVVYYDQSRTTNNHIADSLWLNGSFFLRFLNDAQSVGTPFLQASGGQATGITAVSTNTGIGSWTNFNSAIVNTIFSSSNAAGTSISIRGTASGVNDWQLQSTPAGILNFSTLGTTWVTMFPNGIFTVNGGINATQLNTSGSVFAGTGTTQIGLVPGGSAGLDSLCLTISTGCGNLGSGNFNGVAVDTVNFPNRLEFNALKTMQFFVNNGQLGPDIQQDGTLNLSKPLSINAAGIAGSTAVANRSFPITISGITLYMLLSTTP